MRRFWVGVPVVLVLLGAVPAAAATPVFADGFESGTMAGYRDVQHSGPQQTIVHSGAWAYRATNPNGIASYAYRRLTSASNELWAGAWVYVASRGSTAKLFALRPAAQRSIEVYTDQRGRVSVRNNLGATTTYGSTILATGGWHRVVLHAAIGATSGRFDVSVDGTAVPGLTLTGQNLGTLPLGELRLGDTAKAATFDIVLDDVAVSTSPL